MTSNLSLNVAAAHQSEVFKCGDLLILNSEIMQNDVKQTFKSIKIINRSICYNSQNEYVN